MNGVFHTLLFLLLSSASLLGNAAMPGFYTTGAQSSFQLLYPEDSLYLGSIQMTSERVDMLLFPGFAVVRGSYQFQNLTDSSITLHTGYPIGAYTPDMHLSGQENVNIHLSELFELQVFVNGERQSIITPDQVHGNWHLWQTEFTADELTEIVVYFIVDTNASRALKGYDSERSNGFVYLLESGKQWAGKIERGNMLVHLQEGVTPSNIIGIYPTDGWFYSAPHSVLHFPFLNLEPGPENNLVLRYGQLLEDFNLEAAALSRSNALYQLADQRSQIPLSDLNAVTFVAPRSIFDVEVFPSVRHYIWLTIIGAIILGILVLWGLWKLVFWILK